MVPDPRPHFPQSAYFANTTIHSNLGPAEPKARSKISRLRERILRKLKPPLRLSPASSLDDVRGPIFSAGLTSEFSPCLVGGPTLPPLPLNAPSFSSLQHVTSTKIKQNVARNFDYRPKVRRLAGQEEFGVPPPSSPAPLRTNATAVDAPPSHHGLAPAPSSPSVSTPLSVGAGSGSGQKKHPSPGRDDLAILGQYFRSVYGDVPGMIATGQAEGGFHPAVVSSRASSTRCAEIPAFRSRIPISSVLSSCGGVPSATVVPSSASTRSSRIPVGVWRRRRLVSDVEERKGENWNGDSQDSYI
ncbi:hypothetical protein B0T14DRAFT_569351 [Immersiella caudata]|uniref:Uncharacterized protein n=1 Tax=Immersiella caudata TaxID=314043 RepID=A0AA40BTQ2_9PEZI|nr:hypothetical protein B0T14DRAFT_569351 [Immersiella caudata]